MGIESTNLLYLRHTRAERVRVRSNDLFHCLIDENGHEVLNFDKILIHTLFDTNYLIVVLLVVPLSALDMELLEEMQLAEDENNMTHQSSM